MNDNTVAPAPASTPTQGKDSGAAGFFQEDNGNNSSMRLMCMVALIAAIIFGFLTIFLTKTQDAANNGVFITFGFLISAFAPKAVQKFAEQKVPVIGSK